MAPFLAALAKWGLPLIASAVAGKGKELVEEKLGVNLDDALGTEEGRIKLKQLEYEHEEFLLDAAQKKAELELKEFQIEVADRESARARDAEFMKAGTRNYRADVMFGLAVLLVGGLVWLVWRAPEINEYTKGIVTLVLGRFLGYLDNIYNFEFGTTRSSRTKDDTIANLTGGGK
jgi:hypothetical protein